MVYGTNSILFAAAIFSCFEAVYIMILDSGFCFGDGVISKVKFGKQFLNWACIFDVVEPLIELLLQNVHFSKILSKLIENVRDILSHALLIDFFTLQHQVETARYVHRC